MAVITERPLADIRMTLTSGQFLTEYGGRLPAGTVVLVDAETAERWEQKGIALPSAQTDKTLAEQKRARLAELQAEIEAIETGKTVSVAPNRRVARRV